ncbi:MAG: endonuclease III [Candidatus Brocadiae bacterium]|nr:endonuclease III [Candidatus Brocadiia bacterium]
MNQTKTENKNQVAMEMLALLKANYGDVEYYLNFSNPLQLLVAAILSAQTRDIVVNQVTPELFAKYTTAKDFADAKAGELAECIAKISFAGKKAKSIQEACKILVEKYAGNVPDTMEDLCLLPGVGRKTANAILENAFNKVCGIPVDTHVIRLTYRMGFTSSPYPDKIEKDLMELFPKTEWKKFGLMLKAHGKNLCKTVPRCQSCFLTKLCPKIMEQK